MTTTITTREYAIGPLAAIPQGEGRAFEVAGVRVAVFRTRTNAIYATQAVCPHRGGPLADGLLGGTTVVCPLHSRKYDLTSGETLQGECDIVTYPAWVTDTSVIVVALPE
jgi:nitrite reductase (NADH) small subunit